MTKYQYYKYLSSKTRIVIELGWGEGTGVGERLKKEWIYAYFQLIHAVQQKPGHTKN